MPKIYLLLNIAILLLMSHQICIDAHSAVDTIAENKTCNKMCCLFSVQPENMNIKIGDVA